MWHPKTLPSWVAMWQSMHLKALNSRCDKWHQEEERTSSRRSFAPCGRRIVTLQKGRKMFRIGVRVVLIWMSDIPSSSWAPSPRFCVFFFFSHIVSLFSKSLFYVMCFIFFLDICIVWFFVQYFYRV